jgi:hypothetical protein
MWAIHGSSTSSSSSGGAAMMSQRLEKGREGDSQTSGENDDLLDDTKTYLQPTD